MPTTIAKDTWLLYQEARFAGKTVEDAAEEAGISLASALRYERDDPSCSGVQFKTQWVSGHVGALGVKQRDQLRPEALACLEDFAKFRLRYFGRPSKKWQIAAANQIVALLATPKREYAIINCPPGSGKSTLFTHDIPCWLIARKRSVRIMIGSANEAMARQYTELVKATLERTTPPELEEEQEQRGAIPAVACMAADYGRFKPENAMRWRAGSFKVAQSGNQVGTQKESTVIAVGFDTKYLGSRIDFAVWDDAVTTATTNTAEMREKVLTKWTKEAEKRIEKRGVLLLQGQRIAAEDLYRNRLDVKAWVNPKDEYADPDARKYLHVIFKAHYDELCQGWHDETDPEYDPFDPDMGGCLLDPGGLSYEYLMGERVEDERTYQTVFQQQDMDPKSMLVNPLWVEGGIDPETDEYFPGCWDDNRVLGINPELASAKLPALSVITVDSSPEKFWAIQRWVYDRDTERSFLVDMERGKYRVTDALSFNRDTGEYGGYLDTMVLDAKMQQPSYPVTHLIFEAVAAERFFLDSQIFTEWCSLRGITAIRHDTHRNKQDPRYGLEALIAPAYKYGRVRLPGDQRSGSRKRVGQLVYEVTRYPEGATTDCLMAQWFLLHRLPSLSPIFVKAIKRHNMPSLPSRSLRMVRSA